MDEFTKLVELPECPRYFFDSPQLVKNSTSFRIILNEVPKLEENSTSFRKILIEVTKLVKLPECPK